MLFARGCPGAISAAGPLGDDTDALVAGGVREVIYVEPALFGKQQQDEDQWIDLCTRSLYDLLNSATAVGVKRLTVLGTMSVFEALPPAVAVMARFQPRPSCAAADLGPWLAEYTAREFAVCGAMHVVAARLGTLVPAAEASMALDRGEQPPGHRWWCTPEDVAGALVSELRETPGQQSEHGGAPPAGFVPSYERFRAVNIGRGDGREIDPSTGTTREGWWQRPNGGNSAVPWPEAGAPAAPVPAATAAIVAQQQEQRVLILGAGGMLGPDIVRCLAGDMAQHDGDPTQRYRLLITDVEDRPALRDPAQVERSEARNAGTPSSRPIREGEDPRHDYASVDISSFAEVQDVMGGADVAVM